MTLWEYFLRFEDGTVANQMVLSEGATELEAAALAITVLESQPGIALTRPGRSVSPESAERWREISKTFPLVVSNDGRLALYARGKSG